MKRKQKKSEPKLFLGMGNKSEMVEDAAKKHAENMALRFLKWQPPQFPGSSPVCEDLYSVNQSLMREFGDRQNLISFWVAERGDGWGVEAEVNLPSGRHRIFIEEQLGSR